MGIALWLHENILKLTVICLDFLMYKGLVNMSVTKYHAHPELAP